MNPLAPNLSELSDDQLHERMTKLLNRMTFATRTGKSDVYQQLNMLYQDMLLEKHERFIRKQKELAESVDGDPFENLINVRKQ